MPISSDPCPHGTMNLAGIYSSVSHASGKIGVKGRSELLPWKVCKREALEGHNGDR